MTTKAEEVRAQELVERFLLDLCQGKYSRTPKTVREEAKRRLRHLATPGTVARGSLNGPRPREVTT